MSLCKIKQNQSGLSDPEHLKRLNELYSSSKVIFVEMVFCFSSFCDFRRQMSSTDLPYSIKRRAQFISTSIMQLARAHEIMTCIPGASGCINPEQFIIQMIKSVQLLGFPVEQQAKTDVCLLI